MVCWRKAWFPILGTLFVAGTYAKELKLAKAQDQLTLLDSSHWKTGEVLGFDALILDVLGEQRPPVRRPGEFALVKDAGEVSDFSVVAASLMPDEIVNRDVCLIFGYMDDTHFYYAHISSNLDNKVHNVIMRVNGDSRERINLETGPEARLSNEWKKIRIEHLETGEIKVFVGDMEVPNMTAQDETYPPGQIGFGTFDDRVAFSTLKFN